MRFYCGILAAVLLIGPLGTTPAAAQTGSRLGSSITAISAVVKGSAVAYDPKNSIYLVVSAYGDLNGRFVSAGGDPIGVPFTIQSGASGFTHFPGVAYSPDANGGAGGFLVAWHQSVANGAVIFARMVSSSGVLGPASQMTADGSWWEACVDIAYSTTSKEFLVTWQAAGIRAQRVGNNGEALGANIFVTGTDYHRDPSVAYNPTTNEFMVVYAGYDSSGYVAARRVAAGSGSLPGSETLLNRAANIYITEVAYNPTTNRFLAAWYQGGTYGRLLDSTGNVVSNVLLLATRFSAYDALGIDYNATSSTFMMVSHDSQGLQDGATELSGAGAIPDVGFLATDAATTRGNYYPKIAAHSASAQWLLSTATGFLATTVQRLQSTASGGGTPPPPPPPPPATCAPTPTVTSVSLLSNALTFPIDVTAGSTCPWTATSATPWLQIVSGGNSTGNASVAVGAQRNMSPSPRTGTLTVAGKTITVSQNGFNAAAVHDVDGDGNSDLVWQHQTNGLLAMWGLRGNSVVSALMLNTPGVADTSWKIAGTGDLNGDGYADLVWQRNDGYLAAWYLRGTSVIYYTMLAQSYVGPNWKIRGVGDVNGDGKSDIIWQNDADGSLAVWMMNGFTATSTLMLSVPRMPDPNWIIVGAGDISGDGKADIIWQNQATGGLSAWLLNGNVVTIQMNLSISVVTDLSWKIRGVGDVNGDGMADLLWQNTATGGLAVWYLNGFTVVGTDNLVTNTGSASVSDLNWKVVGPG